ncbi:MAG TPA: LysR family transcriptional regulator [Verrucomicrobiae bacterium]|nr:LysR family transcriptional regulator [Verrucomicrobiae bacterium]
MLGKPSKQKPVLKPRFRVVCGEEIALGPGKVELLSLLVETESLNEAARRLDMSYMRAWKLIKTMNACFRDPVAIAKRGGQTGGGMQVTETGRSALALYREMQASALNSTATSWKNLRKLLKQ